MSSPPGQALPQREQLDLFRALPGDMAPRDSQDLMAFPFFSLAKSRRTAPSTSAAERHHSRGRHAGARHRNDMGCRRADMGRLADRGARDAGLRPSRWIRATPYEILRFIGRGTSLNDYQRLKAALDRLQSTTVATSIRETTGRRLHRFSWINEWKELRRRQRPAGHRADLAGLVLCRRARRRPGADHRPGLFPLEGRYRTLAVPPGAQAWRAAGARLAIRLPTPVPQIRQRGPLRTSPTTCAPWWRGSRARHVLGIERMPDDNTELLTFRPVPHAARG